MRFSEIVSIIMFLFFSICQSEAQTRKELEKQRMEIIKEIEKTSKILDDTKKNKQQNLSRLKALEDQIESRKKLLNTLQQEIAVSENTLNSNLNKLDSLHQKEILLKEQYRSVLRVTYLRKLSNSSWSYLLSSENLNRLFFRWVYLRQYENYASVKASEIEKLSQSIQNKNESIRKIKEERLQIKSQTEVNMKTLTKEQAEKDALIKKLSKTEQNLNTKLAKSQKERENLNAAIEKIIIAELAKSKDAEKTKPESKMKTELDNSDFAKNKGKLPWPVSKGTITGKFGTQPHPTIKSLEVSNNGIDITLKGSDDVQCIFDGEVVGVTNIPGFKNMIIIKHGNYYSVYSKLDQTNVTKGQNLKRGQIIGKVLADDDGKAEIHFELWKDKSKLNPAAWISKN